jgi:hypothetical protein
VANKRIGCELSQLYCYVAGFFSTTTFCGSGVHSVAYAFPKVKLVTTAVDPRINDRFYILPGIGKSQICLRMAISTEKSPSAAFCVNVADAAYNCDFRLTKKGRNDRP